MVERAEMSTCQACGAALTEKERRCAKDTQYGHERHCCPCFDALCGAPGDVVERRRQRRGEGRPEGR